LLIRSSKVRFSAITGLRGSVAPWIEVESRSRLHIVVDNRGMGIIGDGLEILKLVNMGANAELYGKMAKFVEETQELKAKVEALEEANRDLNEQLRFKGSIVRVQGNVYVDGDDEPICSRCADVDHRPVHITHHRDMKMGTLAMCPQCKVQSRRYVLRSKLEGTTE
jgi:hypothetical protein